MKHPRIQSLPNEEIDGLTQGRDLRKERIEGARAALDAAQGVLTKQQRAALEAVFWRGLTYPEAAREL